MIKAIIFDYFGVVSSDDYWGFVGVKNNQKEATFHELSNEVNRGEINWVDFCKEVAKLSGKTVEEVNAMYEQQRINRDLVTLINKLKPKYKIGLLTNASRSYIQPLIEEAHLDSIFDSIVVSSDIGVVKPNKEIYLKIANELSAEPENCLFIDDIISNVEGGERAGMKAVHFTGIENLHKQFSEFGISI